MHRPPQSGKKFPQRVDEVINRRDTPFGSLLKHAAELNRLDRQLCGLLDPQLAPFCQVAELRDDCLILVSPTATQATRLRLLSDEIAQKLNQVNGTCIHRVLVRIAPIRRTNRPQKQKKGLPPAAILALQRFAEDSGDPEIQSIINSPKRGRNGE